MENTGVIVCEHVAKGEEEPRLAFRAEPVSEFDSGWQVFCGLYDELISKAQIWGQVELSNRHPSLRPFLSFPVGTKLIWQSKKGWHVVDKVE